MKKNFFYFLFFIGVSQFQAQVGIGTDTPNNSAMLEVQATDRGILFPRMTSAQRNAIATPATGLHVFDTNTNSLWYYNGTYWVNSKSEASEGDVKSGIQSTDHSGWVLLDGRPISSLSANQQNVAISLGLTANLPNATNAYLVQNGNNLGNLSGSNTKLIAQSNLPNITLSGTTNVTGGHSHTGTTATAGNHNHTGTTSTDGSHNHSYNDRGYGGTGFVAAEETDRNECAEYDSANRTTGSSGNHNHDLTISSSGDHNHSLSIDTSGTHSHTITTNSINGGVSQQAFDVTPRSLSVNMFIYLGI